MTAIASKVKGPSLDLSGIDAVRTVSSHVELAMHETRVQLLAHVRTHSSTHVRYTLGSKPLCSVPVGGMRSTHGVKLDAGRPWHSRDSACW